MREGVPVLSHERYFVQNRERRVDVGPVGLKEVMLGFEVWQRVFALCETENLTFRFGLSAQ